MRKDSYDGEKEKLPPIDFDNLRKSIEFRLIVEICRNLFLIHDRVYYNSYKFNAEMLDRDFKIYKELNKINAIDALP
jgi:hypothetical protein